MARTEPELESLVAEIRGAGGRAIACPADLRERGSAERAVAAAVEAHGGLHVLVNNAGVGANAPLAETSDELWDRIVETNLTAVFRLTRAALPHLAEKGGHVFMVSSLAGTNAIAGMSAYCASKAALDHLAACLMLEVRDQGIKVTTLAPGSVNTSFGSEPKHRRDVSWMLQPEDLAETVLDLLRTGDHALLSRVEMRPLRPTRR